MSSETLNTTDSYDESAKTIIFDAMPHYRSTDLETFYVSVISADSSASTEGIASSGAEKKEDIFSEVAIERAVAAAKKQYPNCVLPKITVDILRDQFSNDKQIEEIGKRLDPILCLQQVTEKDGQKKWYLLFVDGMAEMPLEPGSAGKTREQRIVAIREQRQESPNAFLEEVDLKRYDLVGLAAEEMGKPIDQINWTILSKKYELGDRFVSYAVRRGGRSHRGGDTADRVDVADRLRSAVLGRCALS